MTDARRDAPTPRCSCKQVQIGSRKGLDPTGCPIHGDAGSILRSNPDAGDAPPIPQERN